MSDDFEAITGQLREELVTVDTNPLSVIIDLAEIMRDRTEDEAIALIKRVREALR
jgi:hypothetical protein